MGYHVLDDWKLGLSEDRSRNLRYDAGETASA